MSEAEKPEPIPTALTAPYWAHAREGRLALQRCTACRLWIHFPERRCPRCRSTELAFEPVRGDGTVATFTVVHRSFVPGFDGAPYVLAWIDLPEQEGLRVFGNVGGCAPAEVRIGMPVTVTFEARGAQMLPNFRAIEGESST